jgi:hypothetical protein
MCLISCLVAAKIRNFSALIFKLWMFVHNCENIMSVCMSARFESLHTIVPLYTWLPHFLIVCSFYRWSNLSLYAHARLLLTFVVVSRWTTLDLCRLMWKNGLPWTASKRVDFLHSCGHPEVLWVHRLPRVLNTWGHDHRLAPSLWSKGEGSRVPDEPCLGRVGL